MVPTALQRAIGHLRLAIDSEFDRINEAIGLERWPTVERPKRVLLAREQTLANEPPAVYEQGTWSNPRRDRLTLLGPPDGPSSLRVMQARRGVCIASERLVLQNRDDDIDLPLQLGAACASRCSS